MSERGVFAVDRGIWDHPIFAAEPFTEREAWMWLIGEAAYRARRRRIGDKQINLARGQLAGSVRFFADAWQWHRSKVERFLGRLKSDAMIETRTETGITVINLCNYSLYQKVSLPRETAVETAARQERDKLENNKNIKEDSPLPPSGGKRKRIPKFPIDPNLRFTSAHFEYARQAYGWNAHRAQAVFSKMKHNAIAKNEERICWMAEYQTCVDRDAGYEMERNERYERAATRKDPTKDDMW